MAAMPQLPCNYVVLSRFQFHFISSSLSDSKRGSVSYANKEIFKVTILSFWFPSQNLSEVLKSPVTINIAVLLAPTNLVYYDYPLVYYNKLMKQKLDKKTDSCPNTVRK